MANYIIIKSPQLSKVPPFGTNLPLGSDYQNSLCKVAFTLKGRQQQLLVSNIEEVQVRYFRVCSAFS